MSFKKNNIRDLFLFPLLNQQKNKNFSKISLKFLKKVALIIVFVLLLAFFFVYFEIYVPMNPNSHETIIFTVEKGWGDDEIADNLQKLGLIRSYNFFELYVITSLKHNSLQAGRYNFSSRMSIYDIVNKMVSGDVIKDALVILEGWDKKDIAKYLELKGICEQDYFVSLTKKDYLEEFDFLGDKPKDATLEGYLFPDTYEISSREGCEDILNAMLVNFEKKLSPDLRAEIINQKKSIFDIITMASLLEKEVRTLSDKKIVSGILWKRLSIGMPLQLDATINYITDKNSPSVTIKDTKIDSPYNTYKYKGLPAGPISNPGITSITAAIYPTVTKYWFYLSDGKTHFSETLDQHNRAKSAMQNHI